MQVNQHLNHMAGNRDGRGDKEVGSLWASDPGNAATVGHNPGSTSPQQSEISAHQGGKVL